ncbi:MAG: glycoside hydrolase family 127 protein, partial [Bacteroidales bacterium]|nr:glycoside hydrolase family 127 protein [Bacteroidales bacterium]
MKAAIRYFLLSALFLSAMPVINGKTRKREPFTVPEIKVSTPEGTAPRLPYLIEVKDHSGKTSWKQVRWMNSAKETEEREASLPSGSTYTVQGYILGDNFSENGFPVEASVSVTSEGWAVPERTPVAEPLPLGSVRLIGDNLLTSNRDLDIENLLSLDVTQQLYNFRDTYGLSTEGYKRSDGWDSPTTKLKGHGTGHYMSAMALAYAGTADPIKKTAIKEKIRRVVDELRSCQEMTFVWSDSLGRYFEARDLAPEEELPLMKGTWEAFDIYKKDCAHYGYGYIGAIPAQHA